MEDVKPLEANVSEAVGIKQGLSVCCRHTGSAPNVVKFMWKNLPIELHCNATHLLDFKSTS